VSSFVPLRVRSHGSLLHGVASPESLVDRALALGGSCSGEHGMGLGNRAWAAREHGAALSLMQGVKALFVPHGILNPGKMW